MYMISFKGLVQLKRLILGVDGMLTVTEVENSNFNKSPK